MTPAVDSSIEICLLLSNKAACRYPEAGVFISVCAMPTLLCLPTLPTDSGWESKFLAETVSLREAGESVTLWSEHQVSLLPSMVAVATAAGWESAVEDETVPVLVSPCPPDWLALDEYHRILMICPEAGAENGNFLVSEWPGLAVLPDDRRLLITQLLAGGAEAVDLVHPADALDLNQSWYSGRRVGIRLLPDANE